MLVGRRAERAALQALVGGALNGEGGALLLTGEPGMGKTVLLDDIAARASGDVTTLRASGRESDSDLPFAVLAELLRPAEQEIDALPEPQARALRRALGLEEGDALVDGLAVGVATLGVFATLALRRPVLAIVDDLHWVDEPSRASISFVARHVSNLHIALLCAARGRELGELSGDMPRLELPRLRKRDADELLVGSARVPLDRSVRRRLLELSDGESARARRAANGALRCTASGDRRARRTHSGERRDRAHVRHARRASSRANEARAAARCCCGLRRGGGARRGLPKGRARRRRSRAGDARWARDPRRTGTSRSVTRS